MNNQNNAITQLSKQLCQRIEELVKSLVAIQGVDKPAAECFETYKWLWVLQFAAIRYAEAISRLGPETGLAVLRSHSLAVGQALARVLPLFRDAHKEIRNGVSRDK